MTNYLLYLLGFLPSIIWLIFYLRKDAHPESNSMIMKIFVLGIISGFGAVIAETVFQEVIVFPLRAFFSTLLTSIILVFLGGALIEEYIKYLVVKIWVLKSSELDETVDLVLYMIISSLGFASLENIFVLTNYHPFFVPSEAVKVMALRFISATFLHALCSGLFGVFLVLAFFHLSKRKLFFVFGLFLASLLHGIYNWSMMDIERSFPQPSLEKFILPLLIIMGLFFFIRYWFKKLQRLKSICLIKS